ncbi:MAG: DUF1818 family protein [Elainellaceae cyanobacterium]
MPRYLKQGDGWRLGWDPDAPVFTGLVGSDRWSLELTQKELADFCRLAPELASTMASMAAELMPEERLCCELESEQVWLEAEGFAHRYELHLIVRTGRRGEGYWPPEAVPELVAAAQMLGLF